MQLSTPVFAFTFLWQIAQYCRQGGRLASVELTGQKESQGVLAKVGGKSEGNNYLIIERFHLIDTVFFYYKNLLKGS